MARRSRKRPPARAAAAGAGAPEEPPRRLRGEERDAVVRAELTELAPGERPRPIVVAAVTAALLAVGNVVFYVAGVDVQGEEPQLTGVLLFAGIMLVAAWGLWTLRYWAVLGFQALLAITVSIAALSLMVASNIAAVVLCVAIILAGGWLFWKLVRVLGRMKVPRPGE